MTRNLLNPEATSERVTPSPEIIQQANARWIAGERSKVRRVLFLCTGNYYRSRFAEMLFNHLAAQRRLIWQAASRGLRLTNKNVGPIAECTLAALVERQVELPVDHAFPQAASDADFEAADWVIAVKRGEHEPIIAERFVRWSSKVRYWGIHDVDCAPPETAIAELDAAVRRLIEEIETAT